jgi:hypothetical protein
LSKLTPSVTAMNDFLSFFVTKLEYSAITEKLVSNLSLFCRDWQAGELAIPKLVPWC